MEYILRRVLKLFIVLLQVTIINVLINEIPVITAGHRFVSEGWPR